MLFHFRLAALEDIPPWGKEGDFHLSWFGLTDGCYWLRAGDVELFRYNQTLLEMESWRTTSAGCGPYVDYQVVRLWEDVLEILPEVLTPVPQGAAEILAAPTLRAWRAAVANWLPTNPDDAHYLLYEAATEWVRKRHLISGHLMAGPRIWFWSDGTYIHLEWDNRELEIDGVPAWDAQLGNWRLPVDDFLAEVRAFDRALIEAMRHRVEQIAAGWSRSDVRINVDDLLREHADRATWLEKSLKQAEQNHDWSLVLQAIAIIDRQVRG